MEVVCEGGIMDVVLSVLPIGLSRILITYRSLA